MEEEGLIHLPFDLVLYEIFSRVPIESQTRLRTTCRAFYNQTFDTDYIYKHLDLCRQRFLRLDHMVHVIDPVSNAVNSTAMLRCLNHGNTISSVIHCDGLLLCRNQRTSMLTLWNPYQKQVRQIQPPMGFFSAFDRYGLGYRTDARSNYKVLRIFDAELNAQDGKDEDQVEIFDTETRLWRRVLDATPLDCKIEGLSPGLSVKGNMYWIATPKASLRSGIVGSFIQCFDFSKETFIPICALPVGLDYDPNHTNSLSVYKGCSLSLLHQRLTTTDMEVWVTNPLADEVVAWTHQFSVDNPNLPPLRAQYEISYPVHFINGRDLLVVLCREDDGDNTDEDNDADEGTTHIRMYTIGKDGIQHRTDMGQGVFFEHVMCGYIYTPSRVTVHN
ncbi:PREDICTED: putative F-box protein At3g22650 [Camelina sativa]|uniref:F-box protein At3g22650 n=1 Tax=Camelina sativa TaxID=90675 RepID=A0ABM0ZAP0_CAMSA|nr:PREDICTED: putative F-box protein At3g22650 [Camelina sativa]